jgi:hypothetical protein
MLAQRFLIPVFALIAWPTSAATVTYTDPATFNNATQSLFFTQINFNTATFLSSNGYTDASGAVFDDSNQNRTKLGRSASCFNTCTNGEVTDAYFGFSISLPINIGAFAFYVASPQGETVTVSFSGSGAPFSTQFTAVSSGVFFGTTTDTPVTGFTISGQIFQDTIALDNFEIAQSGPPPPNAPEAATFLLIGSGLVFMRLLRRRPRTQPARRGAVSTIFTGIIRALSRVLPENTTSASAPRCVSTR